MANLQLRDVPDDLADRARSRAARLDLSMSAYLRMILEADVTAHAWDDWAQTHSTDDVRPLDPADAVSAIRAGRAEREEAVDRTGGT